ncbi:MAG: hypothetical protein FJ296_06575, partial [Planctomycetes bacterium]|nr:hypothetical protein [Planctomycetota bacterium]
SDPLLIHGERYVALSRVAQLWDLRIEWLREVCEAGLLDPLERAGDEPAIAARHFDRLATIQRLNVVQGVNLPGVAMILDLLESRR